MIKKINPSPTPYPDVNKILQLLFNRATDVLKTQFVGMYLYGSLSGGDFNPESSDIDFLFVTDDTLSEETISELAVMHKEIGATGMKWAGKLEGAYVSRDLIRQHLPDGASCPTVNEGRFYIAPLGSDWIIQRHIVREFGIVIDGPDPKTLIDYVSQDDIRTAVRGILSEWWFPMLDDPARLRDRGDTYRAYALISMCRALHALEHGTIISKPKAVQWARTKLDEAQKRLINEAVSASQHTEQAIPLNATLDFIRFIHEQVKNP